MVDEVTTPIPSITEPAVDRYRKWSPVWYPWIKKMLDTLKSTAAGVTAVTETVDQVKGSWTIARNVNGRVIGQIKLDGTATETTFSVLADKFIIVHPAANATTMQAFIVGNVNGVPTVGVNGNLIVDGTILARHIAVDSLDAIAANFGTITAGKMQRADGTMIVDLDNKRIKIST